MHQKSPAESTSFRRCESLKLCNQGNELTDLCDLPARFLTERSSRRRRRSDAYPDVDFAHIYAEACGGEPRHGLQIPQRAIFEHHRLTRRGAPLWGRLQFFDHRGKSVGGRRSDVNVVPRNVAEKAPGKAGSFRNLPIGDAVLLLRRYDALLKIGRQRPIKPSLYLWQDFCWESRLPPLTAIVIGKSSKLPGSGFFAWDVDD
jgi:hypothetical protein